MSDQHLHKSGHYRNYSVLQADINLFWLCLEEIETAWLWLACLLGQPGMSCKERAHAEHCAHEHKQLLFLSKHWKNNLVYACHKKKDRRLVERLFPVSLLQKCWIRSHFNLLWYFQAPETKVFRGIWRCRSPVSALWLSRYLLVSFNACKSLKIWLVGT